MRKPKCSGWVWPKKKVTITDLTSVSKVNNFIYKSLLKKRTSIHPSKAKRSGLETFKLKI